MWNVTYSNTMQFTDPYNWTAEHSGRWLSDMCMQFQLPPPRQLFLSGRALLSMSAEEFLARAPEGGDTLHAQLQLWKTGKRMNSALELSSAHVQLFCF